MQDYAKIFKTARYYYDENHLIQSYVDMFLHLSLNRATISPNPTEEWLTTLSAGVLDFWKTGELYMVRNGDDLVFCDPVDVKIVPGSIAADEGLRYEYPDYWLQAYRNQTIPILNAMDQRAERGLPVAAPQLTLLAKLAQMGQPQTLSISSFGFSDKKNIFVNATSIAHRIMVFRKKLGQGLNKLWPDFGIDLYSLGPTDILSQAKNFGFIS